MPETYVKSYDVGNIQLDAPYAHFIHYLPLLSFGDIVHTVGLSLVYHSRLTDNPFNIAQGFKLNVQKRLIISNNVPTGIEEGGGRLISLNNFSPNYMLDDESQRVLRTVTENGVVYYELENPDYSNEKYNSLGQIISMTDKYGEAYLLFNYTSGKLTSVSFRPSIYNGAKVINLSYANDRLDYVEYISGNSAFRTNFSYNNGLVVKHYSGVDYHIENAEDYIVYSADNDSSYSDSYSQKLTCNKSTDSISVEKRIGTKPADTTAYQFYELNESERFKILEITDKHGIKTRVQYEGNIPKYSYEYTGEISPHYNKCYSGTVSIYKKNEVVGAQTYDSGIKMTNETGANTWTTDVNLSQATEDCYFILSGWILTNHLPQCELTISDNLGNQVKSIITNLGYSAFKYFSVKFDFPAPQSITVTSNLDTDNMLTRDFRISVNKGGGITDSATNHFTLIDEVLIPEQEAPGGHKEFPVAITDFYNGNNQILQKITYNDILRYKINQRLGAHPNEIYYDGGRGIISNAGEFRIKYRTPSDGEDIIIKIDDLAIGKNFYKNGNKHTQKTDFSDNLGYPNLTTRKYTNGRYYEHIFYDDKLNEIIVFENDYNATYITVNEKGLITTKAIIDLSNNNRIETHYTYDDNNTKLLSATDEFGNVTAYITDDIWGVVTGTVLPDETTVTDEYDKEAIALVSKTFAKNTDQLTHTFDYSGGNLSSVAVSTLNYGFNYTTGDLVGVTKFGNSIESYTLTDNDKTITKSYPSGYSVTQRMDNYGRVAAIDGKTTNTYDVSPSYSSDSYTTLGVDNGSGKLATSTDAITGNVTKYAYNQDLLYMVGRFNSTGTLIAEEGFVCDSLGRLTQNSFIYDIANSNSVTCDITYDLDVDAPKADNRVKTYTFKHNGYRKSQITNTYDAYKRIQQKKYHVGKAEYIKSIEYDKTRPARVIDKKDLLLGDDVTLNDVTYEYDALGRITCEKDGSNNVVKRYSYDTYGQFTREDNAALDKTYVYEYNGIGNVASVQSYAYTTGDPMGTPGTTSFSYSGDKLTSFGSKAITYNSNGGVSSYNGWTYNWSNGRLSGLMMNMSSTARIPSIPSSKSYAFTYNALGQRIGVSYNYFINSSDITPVVDTEVISYNKEFGYDSAGRLIFETTAKTFHSGATSSVKIIFLYDENSMVGFEYITADGNNIYYYLRNLQGDVIAIYDSYGNKVVDYTYDAWGNCTIQSTTTNYTVAHANPIRYRGYYYDEDTGLYYLNARYYNPEWRRFISPDDSAYLDPETPNGLNLYAYCNNDPVNYVDPSGHSIILTTALILMGIGITAGIGYAAYNDYQDDSSINNSIGWQTYVGSAMIGGAIGFGLGYFGPTIASLLGSSFSFALPTLGTLNAGGALALSGSVTLTGAQIAGGALVAGLGIMLFARPNSGKIRYSDGTGKDPSTGKDFTDPNKAREYYKSINNPTEKAKWKRWLKGKGWIKNHLKGFFFASLSIEWLRYIFDESR